MPLIDVEMQSASSSTTNTLNHHLPTNNSQNSNQSTSSTRKISSGKDDGDEDIDEYNDSDDFDDPPEIMDEDSDMFMSTGAGSSTEITTSRRPPPLLPDDYGDEAMAAIKFSEEFSSRYGRPHPEFFPAALDDAIKESCMQPAKDVSSIVNLNSGQLSKLFQIKYSSLVMKIIIQPTFIIIA